MAGNQSLSLALQFWGLPVGCPVLLLQRQWSAHISLSASSLHNSFQISGIMHLRKDWDRPPFTGAKAECGRERLHLRIFLALTKLEKQTSSTHNWVYSIMCCVFSN